MSFPIKQFFTSWAWKLDFDIVMCINKRLTPVEPLFWLTIQNTNAALETWIVTPSSESALCFL